MQLSIRECVGRVVAGLSGELDTANAADVAVAVMAILARERCLIMDLAALEYIDCCALGALRRMQRRARQRVATCCWPRRGNWWCGF